MQSSGVVDLRRNTMSEQYAFPFQKHGGFHVDHGVTLRDYFAAKAMCAVELKKTDSISIEKFCEDCYKIADQMRLERQL